MAKRFSIEAVFSAVDRITRPLARMRSRFKRFTRGVSMELGKVNRLADMGGRAMKRFGLATVAGLATIAGGLTHVSLLGAEFEQTLVNAGVKFKDQVVLGTDAFAKMQATAEQLGATTEFTATKVAEALNFLAMAGFNSEAAIAALPGVLDLATVAQTDLATATDIATDSLGAYGLLTKDAAQQGKNLARVNDVIALTTSRANTNVEQMFEALKTGGPVARAAGANIETAATLIATMADAGIKGERAGTALKRIFLAVGAPGSKEARIFKRLGVDVVDADKKIRDIVDIMEDLRKATSQLTQSERLGVIDAIFGKIPVASAINVMERAGDEMRAFRKELELGAGASQKMAAIQRDTFKGSYLAFLSAIESVKISIFGLTKGPLKEVVDQTTDWIRANKDLIALKVGDWIKWIVANIGDLIKWGKRIVIIGTILLTLITVVKTLTAVMTVLNIVMAMNPVGLIIIAIGALIAGIVSLIIYFDDIKAWFTGLPAWAKIAAAGLVLLTGPIGWLATAATLIISNWDTLKKWFKIFWEQMTLWIEDPMGQLKELIRLAKEAWEWISKTIASPTVAAGAGTSAIMAGVGSSSRGVSLRQGPVTTRNTTETKTTGEVVIRDETGRAEPQGRMPAGVSVERTGGF